MALYKIDNKVTTEQGLNTKKPNSLNVIKKGSFYFQGREGSIALDGTTYRAYTLLIRIHHGLDKLFLTPGVTAVCDRFSKITDVITGNENISNIKPWIAGGLYASTGTAYFRRAQVLSSDYLSLMYTIVCTSGTVTISDSPRGWVQWQILNSDDSGNLGGYGMGGGGGTGKYYYLDQYDFDVNGNLWVDPEDSNSTGHREVIMEYANDASYLIEPNLFAGDLG